MRNLAGTLERGHPALDQPPDRASRLEGAAGDEVLTRLADHYAVTQKVNEGGAAVLGGLFTGALAG
jgi:hypothetical protein